MKIVNENNYYTLYWHNGDRNIVKGGLHRGSIHKSRLWRWSYQCFVLV